MKLHDRDTWEHDKLHREKRLRKYEKIQMLRALLEMHEAGSGRRNYDHAYVLALRARLRSAENQFAAMKI